MAKGDRGLHHDRRNGDAVRHSSASTTRRCRSRRRPASRTLQMRSAVAPRAIRNDAIVRVDQRQNTNELITLDGWELTYVQPLDFLLQGAGFTVNYTHIDQKSEGGLPGAASSAITGLSPFTYNVTAFYENYRILGPPDVLGARRLRRVPRQQREQHRGRQLRAEAQVPRCVVQLQVADGHEYFHQPRSCRTSLNEQLLTYFRNDPAHAARFVRAGPPDPARHQRFVLTKRGGSASCLPMFPGLSGIGPASRNTDPGLRRCAPRSGDPGLPRR